MWTQQCLLGFARVRCKVPRLERTNERGEDVSEEEASSEASYCVDVIKC